MDSKAPPSCPGLPSPGTPWSEKHLFTPPSPEPGSSSALLFLLEPPAMGGYLNYLKRNGMHKSVLQPHKPHLKGPGASCGRWLPYWMGLVGNLLSSQAVLFQIKWFHLGQLCLQGTLGHVCRHLGSSQLRVLLACWLTIPQYPGQPPQGLTWPPCQQYWGGDLGSRELRAASPSPDTLSHIFVALGVVPPCSLS